MPMEHQGRLKILGQEVVSVAARTHPVGSVARPVVLDDLPRVIEEQGKARPLEWRWAKVGEGEAYALADGFGAVASPDGVTGGQSEQRPRDRAEGRGLRLTRRLAGQRG